MIKKSRPTNQRYNPPHTLRNPPCNPTRSLKMSTGHFLNALSCCQRRSNDRELKLEAHQMMAKLKASDPKVESSKQIRASVIVKWLKIHNLRETQYLAGHRYISSTESYLQNDMEGLKEEVDKFHPLG